jgi:hypothetical protein
MRNILGAGMVRNVLGESERPLVKTNQTQQMTMTTSKPIALVCMCYKRARSELRSRSSRPLTLVVNSNTKRARREGAGRGGGGLTVGSVRGAGDDGELAAGVDVLEYGLFEPREVAVTLLEQRLDPVPRHRAKVHHLCQRRWRSVGEGGSGETGKG